VGVGVGVGGGGGGGKVSAVWCGVVGQKTGDQQLYRMNICRHKVCGCVWLCVWGGGGGG
jgi:hypothetical protein